MLNNSQPITLHSSSTLNYVTNCISVVKYYTYEHPNKRTIN